LRVFEPKRSPDTGRRIITQDGQDRIGAVPFLIRSGRVVILVVTSMSRVRWVFPKGQAEDGETHQQTCLRETFEEAGVDGFALTDFPFTEGIEKLYGDVRRLVPVTFYPLAVEKVARKWPEKGKRLRHWVLLEDADKLIRDRDVRRVLSAFRKALPQIRTATVRHR
jgi:8-oxo-dGTP pyrophosphatase MutT (NUDIX family)